MNEGSIADAAREFVARVRASDALANRAADQLGLPRVHFAVRDGEQEAWDKLLAAIDEPDPRTEPPSGSTPEGEGFGKPWVPRERTFLVRGAVIRSIILPERGGRGAVAIDLVGRWNHGDAEDLSLIAHRQVADEWAVLMRDAVAAAGEDEAVWRARQR